MKKPLAVIVLNWNGSQDTCACLQTLLPEDDATIFVADNGSEPADFSSLSAFVSSLADKKQILSEDEFARMDSFPDQVYLIRHAENYGFAGGNNRVMERVLPFFDNVLFLNNDTEVPQGIFGRMLGYLSEHPEIGMLSCDIRYYFDKTKLWNAGGNLTFYGDRKYHSEKKIARLAAKGCESIACSFLTGCALMIRGEVLEKHGGFTEDFFFGEEDFNLCMRYKKAGVRGVSLLQTVIYHKVGSSASRTSDSVARTTLHYLNRVVDMKRFYSRFYWRLWRRFYLFLVLLKGRGWGFSKEESRRLVSTVRTLSEERTQVDRETFLMIMKK